MQGSGVPYCIGSQCEGLRSVKEGDTSVVSRSHVAMVAQLSVRCERERAVGRPEPRRTARLTTITHHTQQVQLHGAHLV